jgi:hypothetical protein
VIISDELARRLEYAEAVDAAGCVDAECCLSPNSNAEAKGVAGGFLTFCGTESPLTHAIGVGMHGPVSVDEVYEIEHFFRSRGAAVAIDVCPHADASLRDILCQRGYRITEFNDVLVRPLPAGELPEHPSHLEIRTAGADEEELYARTVVRGFFGRDEMTDAEYRLGRILFHMPCSNVLMAFADGEAAGCGGLSIRNRVANFFGDATLRSQRNRGSHSALIAERLRIASADGCDVATAGTQPGSTSQANYQRFGFEVAYSKITMVLD